MDEGKAFGYHFYFAHLTSTLTGKFIHPASASAESVSDIRTGFSRFPSWTEDPDDYVIDVGISFFKLPTRTNNQPLSCNLPGSLSQIAIGEACVLMD